MRSYPEAGRWLRGEEIELVVLEALERLDGAASVDVERERNGKRSRGIKRSTFVIAPDGTVAKAMYAVRPEGHAAEVLDALPS